MALAQSLCGQYGYYANAGYYLNNNRWGQGSGQGSQCLIVDWTNSDGVGWHVDWTWSGSPNNVKSYPYSGITMSSKRLVSRIGYLGTSATWKYSNTNIRANVAYDLFTAANPNHDPSSGDYELMIWLARFGDIQPIGSSQGRVTVGSYSWELWYGVNNGMKIYSFVASSPINDFNANLKPFFNYLQNSKGFPASSQYLITYQFGTEPFTGGPTTFSVSRWNAKVN
ncbi:murein transglycosylase [Colletotrichum incanum]|uniref:Murein transglycosylase n=1 Tax=Colletotrichum incanum TaxID=1573173 RepID=A0A167CI53_COLIC|nr:murein transglycosylase [Colletotrichum incanum]